MYRKSKLAHTVIATLGCIFIHDMLFLLTRWHQRGFPTAYVVSPSITQQEQSYPCKKNVMILGTNICTIVLSVLSHGTERVICTAQSTK
jgi:hypothetical protein